MRLFAIFTPATVAMAPARRRETPSALEGVESPVLGIFSALALAGCLGSGFG